MSIADIPNTSFYHSKDKSANDDISLSQFLEAFPIRPHHMLPKSRDRPWVFWSQNEGSENHSSSSDPSNSIHDKIRSVFSNLKVFMKDWAMIQFWTPVTIDGRQLLSTSGQPYAVAYLTHELAMYRQKSEKYKYNIDANKIDNGCDSMILSGGPATAFLIRLTHLYDLQKYPEPMGSCQQLGFSVRLPICFPSQSSCLGVIEMTFHCKIHEPYWCYVLELIKELQEVGLDVFYAQDLIPYKTVDGLKLAKDKIKEALEAVCKLHDLLLAQVWVTNEDKSLVLLSPYLEDTQTNPLLKIKLTGYVNEVLLEHDDFDFISYDKMCDITHHGMIWEDKFSLGKHQDYESCYISTMSSNMIVDWGCSVAQISVLRICLRSGDTGGYNYFFEFTWFTCENTIFLLEAIILTLKWRLPNFKFASGEELGDELDVSDVDGFDDENGKLKIFQGKRSSVMLTSLDKGKKLPCLEGRSKTTPIKLTMDEVEKHHGKPLDVAANLLNVSRSTLRRWWNRESKKQPWPGPKSKKRKANDSSIIQINTNEEDDGAIQDPLTVKENQNFLTVKFKYGEDTTRFDMRISEATFVTIEKEIVMTLKLSVGTYKLKYLDEDGEWMSFTSDKDLGYCIKSTTKSGRTVIRLCVLPSP